MDHFVNAAIFNEKDNMKSVSSRIAVGRVIPGGTGAFDLLLDTKKLENSENIKAPLMKRNSKRSLRSSATLNQMKFL